MRYTIFNTVYYSHIFSSTIYSKKPVSQRSRKIPNFYWKFLFKIEIQTIKIIAIKFKIQVQNLSL